eukprot:sb/3479429/
MGFILPCLRVVYTPEKGRHVVSVGNIMAGSNLMTEGPISVVSKTPAHCNTCLEPAEGNWTCGSCPVPEMISENYLANLCYKTVLHCLEDLEYTLEGFKERQRDPYREEDDQNFLRGFDAVAALNVPPVPNKSASCCDYSAFCHNPISEDDIQKIVRAVADKQDGKNTRTKLSQIEHVVRHVASTLPCNTEDLIEVSEEKLDEPVENVIGRGMYAFLTMFNHSCLPNTRIYFEGTRLNMVAIKSIGIGEEVFHNYGPNPIYMPNTPERKKLLLESFHFTCDCLMCELGINLTDCLNCPNPNCNEYVHMSCGKECEECGQPINRDEILAPISTYLEDVMKILRLREKELRDVVTAVKNIYYVNNGLLVVLMPLLARAAEDEGNLPLAINCIEATLEPARGWQGELSHAYAFKLLDLSFLRIKYLRVKHLLEEGVDEELKEIIVKDAKSCVRVLSELRIGKHIKLETVKKFLEKYRSIYLNYLNDF